MFDLSSLQYNSEYPGFISIVFTIICAIVLGTLLAYTYEKTSREVNRPNHFLQAMILVTIVSAMIMQAIGDSVARGLGMLGALSIIRFRTTVRDSRNIVFMFSAIAIGISCGVFGFLIAIVGTIGFCATAFLLRYSSFSTTESTNGTLRIGLNKSLCSKKDFEAIIKPYCQKYLLKLQQANIKKGLNFTTYEYDIQLKNADAADGFLENLVNTEGISVKNFVLKVVQVDSI